MNEIIKISNNLPQNFERLPLNLQTNCNEKIIFDIQKQLPALSEYESYYHYKCALLVIFKYLNLDYKETVRGEGTKDIPDSEGMQLIYNTVKDSFPKFNANDIVFAFILAMQGKIKHGNENIDLKLYGNKFNALYLTIILNAYASYRREIIYKYNEIEKNNQKLLPQQCEYTEQEKENIIKSGIIRIFNEYKNGKKLVGVSHIFDYLIKKGLLEVEKGSEEWHEKYQKAVENIKNEKTSKAQIHDLRMFIKNMELQKELSEIDIEIKILFIAEYFDSIIEFEDNIENYLK